MVKNEVLLKDASRDELIDELKKRKSISNVFIPNNSEAATVESKSSRISVIGEAYIFVISPHKETTTAANSDGSSEKLSGSIFIRTDGHL